jgi:small subunit ribosomal protein S9
VASTIVQYLGTGRRKTSVARVFLRPGKGEIKVNNRAFENYFPTESTRAVVRQALAATETTDKFDLIILATAAVSPARRVHAALAFPGL